MKLSKIEITNFRCFESQPVDLQSNVNVFVGVNGAGKTALLDALAIVLFEVVAANSHGGRVSLWRQRKAQKCVLKLSDIHIPPGSPDAVTNRRDFVTVRAAATEFYELPGFPARTPLDKPASLEWAEHVTYQMPAGFQYESSKSDRLANIHGYFREMWQEIKKSDSRALIPVPVVAYYRANRRLNEMPEIKDVFKNPPGVQDVFENALNAGENYEAMCRWFYVRENTELREKLQVRGDKNFQFPDLKAARAALLRTLEGVKRVFFAESPPSLKVAFDRGGKAEEVFELEQLSDGYRNLLALVLDFARRLALANPTWKNPLDAPGILMIDEIDLHLHPVWQQKIVPSLQAVFPHTQLIVATHSPHVVTTVESNCVQIIENGKLRPCPVPTYGARSSDVVSEVMGLPSQRPPDNPNAQKISRLFKAIDDGDLAAARSVRAELAEWVKGFPEPDLVRADLMIRRLEVKANGKDAAKS